MSLNQCNFIGNLGQDPEQRTLSNGNKVTNLRLAVSERWRDKNTGENKEKTEWVSVAIFGPLADVAANYLRKGSKVFVSGKFTTRKWQDQSGQDRYSSEIVLQGPQAVLQMLDSKRDGQADQGDGYSAGGNANAGRDIDNEIPF